MIKPEDDSKKFFGLIVLSLSIILLMFIAWMLFNELILKQ